MVQGEVIYKILTVDKTFHLFHYDSSFYLSMEGAIVCNPVPLYLKQQ